LKLIKIPLNIGGSHIIVPLDLRDISRNFGRPLWARYSFQQAIELALEKMNFAEWSEKTQ
jgi:hypothetical protein